MLLAENLKNYYCIGHDYELNVLLVLTTSWSTTIPHVCLAHFCGTFRPAPRSCHENRRVEKTRRQIGRQKKAVAPGVFWLPHGPCNGDFFWLAKKGDLNTRAAELEVGEAIIKHTAEFRIPYGKG